MAETLTVSAPATLPALRIIPDFDCDERLVALAQTAAGRVVLTAVMVTVSIHQPLQLAAIGAAALVAYCPQRRAILMPAASVAVALITQVATPGGLTPSSAIATVAIFGVAAALIVVAGRTGRRGPFARPALSLIAAVLLLSAIGCLPDVPPAFRATIWLAATTLTAYKWFLAYALTNAAGRKRCPPERNFAMINPFWGSTTKGAAFIAKFEAQTAAELAVTQLKAIKLILWAMLLRVAGGGFDLISYDRLGIPTLDDAVAAYAIGNAPGHAMALAAIGAHFVSSLLHLAVVGHFIIAIARFAGFRLPRNTCRPLEARSIAEFWNRYYYYFKELMVDFFFLPAFARLAGWSPRTRILAATFFSAGVGNYLFHFTRDIDFIRTMGWRAAIEGSATYAFYCLLLSVGIGCSQMCNGAAERRPLPPIMAQTSVVSFYAFVSVFAYDGRVLSLGAHLRFLLYILGLSR